MDNLRLSLSDAEVIALKALSFLVSEPDQTGRFLRITGLEPHDLAQRATDPDFLAGVVEHLMSDESLLLMFAEDNSIDPKMAALAAELLRGGRHVD